MNLSFNIVICTPVPIIMNRSGLVLVEIKKKDLVVKG